MLIDFTIENYKSFKSKTVFSMLAAPKQKGLDYSIQNEKIAGTSYKGLSSAVIYGPNASGKTNLIGAMDTMKAIVLRGNIKNSSPVLTPNTAAYNLELIPYFDGEIKPTLFSIRFIDMGMVIQYSFTIELGSFLDREFERKIIDESLFINNRPVFERKEQSLNVATPSVIKKYLNKSLLNNINSAIDIAKNGIDKQELFLTNGFKAIFAPSLVSIISEWFDEKFIVIYRSDAIKTMQKFSNPDENTIYVAKTLTEAAKEFGINSNNLGYKVSKENNQTLLYSLFDSGNDSVAIPADIFESYGTVRFIHEFPLVINAIMNGATLVMDEFDASIHPMAIMNIIGIFHNDDINKYHAQLIFNTHNPIFLNSSLFRRDEIKFVERDADTHESVHYSLSDFKTSGSNGVRKGEDYMKNYFVSQYGAVSDIDFSPIFEEVVDLSGEENNG